jgi:hypothetical protein
MTPLECAEGITAFIRRRVQECGENLRTIREDGTETIDEIKVHTGFLPRAATKAEIVKLCPAIIVRPESVSDEEERTVAHIILYVTTFDADMTNGYVSLYHLLEWLRQQLLTFNPIPNEKGQEKWKIVDGTMKNSVPDDQPFPQWWGYIECDIYLPQPQTNYTLTFDWRREHGQG